MRDLMLAEMAKASFVGFAVGGAFLGVGLLRYALLPDASHRQT